MVRSLLPILLLALVIRLGFVLTRPAALDRNLPDQSEYLATGRNLLHGDGLQFYDPRFGQTEWAFRTPPEPMLVAMAGGSIVGVRVLQALLDASVVLAVMLITRRAGRRAAIVAGLFVALDPFLIYFSGLVLSETLFTALLVWGLAGVANRKWIGLMLLALAALTKPSAALLPVIAAGIAWAGDGAVGRATGAARPAILLAEHTARQRRGLPMLLATGAAALITIAALLPWAARNQARVGAWIWTSTNTGQTAWDGFGPAATGESNLADLAALPQLRGLGEVDRDRVLRQMAGEFMRADIGRSMRLAITKIARTWSPVPLSDAFGSTAHRIIGLAYCVPLFGLAIIGLLRRTVAWRIKALCVLPAIYFTLSVAASVGSLRYRVPAEPMLAVLAGAAMGRKEKSPAIAIAGLSESS